MNKLRRLSKVRGILLSKGFVILPEDFKGILGCMVETFINEKFRVDVDDEGETQSSIEWHHPRFISQCKEFWYNKANLSETK